MAVLQVGLIDVHPGREADFERDLPGVIWRLVKADGCKAVNIVRSLEKPSRYRMLVSWESKDHHIAFRKTETVVPLKAMLASYAAARHDTEHVTAVFSTRKIID